MSLYSRLPRFAAALGIIASFGLTACGAPPAQVRAPQAAPTADVQAVAGASQASVQDAELTVWYFDKVSMQTVIPLFEQSHPGVHVNFVEQPFGDMSKKYLAALAAGQGVPDVIGLDTSMVGQFLDAGDNLLAEPYSAGQLKQDFIDWKFNAALTSDGALAAMPWDVATGVMFYRPDVFQSAGLP